MGIGRRQADDEARPEALRLAIRAERDRATMTEARIAEVLGRVPDYSSPFDERMPAI